MPDIEDLPESPSARRGTTGGDVPETETSRGRTLVRDFIRPGRGQLTVGVILMLTALLIVMTLKSQAAQSSYSNLRRTELIQLLDNLSAETRRLEADIRDLQRTRDELASGAEGIDAARAEANRRLDELKIIAGTIPVHGPGVRITISDPENRVSPELLLDGLEELRDAGAEVMEINNLVRVTASTWLGLDAQGQVIADSQVISEPIIFEVIGDPATLEAGARFRGGLVSEIEGARVEGRATIEQLERVDIDSVVVLGENEFARPK